MTKRAQIIVLDDDDDLRESICDLLSDQGYVTCSFADGVLALESLRTGECRPALILLDLMMPGMNGWDFRDAQLGEASLASIPVVVMTASRNLHENPISADEILLKPFKLRALLNVIERHAPS